MPKLWMPRRLLRLLARKMTTSIDSDWQIAHGHCFQGRSARVRSYRARRPATDLDPGNSSSLRSEEHTSELQSLMRISYAVFCLKKKKKKVQLTRTNMTNSQESTDTV